MRNPARLARLTPRSAALKVATPLQTWTTPQATTPSAARRLTAWRRPAPARRAALRLPSARASAVLAAVMLGVGIAVGAAIGPAPETSLAGNAGVMQKLPALIAALAARPTVGRDRQAHPRRPGAAGDHAAGDAPPAAPRRPRARRARAAQTTPAPRAPSESETSTTPKTTNRPARPTLPPITSVWLIQLSGVSFAEALANPAAAPYITGQLIPKGTYLSGWSALSASAFANDAALAEHRAALGAAPPLLHSIVQPPCPEGAAGAACAAGTPGALTAADQFLQATLATITATTTYAEHGLVVVTFATVADATAAELPAGASTATLTSQPPAGAVLLSPFAKAGARSTATFNPTSPKQSLEKLLH